MPQLAQGLRRGGGRSMSDSPTRSMSIKHCRYVFGTMSQRSRATSSLRFHRVCPDVFVMCPHCPFELFSTCNVHPYGNYQKQIDYLVNSTAIEFMSELCQLHHSNSYHTFRTQQHNTISSQLHLRSWKCGAFASFTLNHSVPVCLISLVPRRRKQR